MKKWIILLLCTVFLLTACAHEPASSNPAAESQTLALTPEDRSQSWNGMYSVELPEGYYFAFDAKMKDSISSLIFFLPRGESSCVPLCGKPNCHHADLNCNARIDIDAFGYWNGALDSFDAIDRQLIRMNLDGTNHQIAAQLELSGIPEDSSLMYTFHHGKLLCFFTQEGVPLEERERHLISVDLGDYSQQELAADFFRTVYDLDPFEQFYRDKIYMRVVSSPESYEEQFVELDVHTGETKTLMQGFLAGTYVTDSTVYYMENGSLFLNQIYQEEVGAETEHARFREYDRQTGEIRSIEAPVLDEELILAVYDEDYIYAHGELYTEGDTEKQNLYILSRDYQLLDRLCLENDLHIAVAGSDRVFFTDERNAPIKYYLDKSEIGSHQLTLHPLEVIGFPQGEASGTE